MEKLGKLLGKNNIFL